MARLNAQWDGSRRDGFGFAANERSAAISRHSITVPHKVTNDYGSNVVVLGLGQRDHAARMPWRRRDVQPERMVALFRWCLALDVDRVLLRVGQSELRYGHGARRWRHRRWSGGRGCRGSGLRGVFLFSHDFFSITKGRLGSVGTLERQSVMKSGTGTAATGRVAGLPGLGSAPQVPEQGLPVHRPLGHRAAGRVLVVFGLVVALTGLRMAQFYACPTAMVRSCTCCAWCSVRRW
jgi:hypothetical protein